MQQQPTEFEAAIIALPRAMIMEIWEFSGFYLLRNGKMMKQLPGEGRNRRGKLLPLFHSPRDCTTENPDGIGYVISRVFLGRYLHLQRYVSADVSHVQNYVQTELYGRVNGSDRAQGGGYFPLFRCMMPHFKNDVRHVVGGGWQLHEEMWRDSAPSGRHDGSPYDTEEEHPFHLLPNVYGSAYRRCFPWGRADRRAKFNEELNWNWIMRGWHGAGHNGPSGWHPDTDSATDSSDSELTDSGEETAVDTEVDEE